MRHVISALVQNQPGVLARVSGLFSGRAFNIDSLTAGETEDPAFSRLTIVTHGDDRIIEQIIKQLRKLVDILKVQDLTANEHVERDLVLIRVNAPPDRRSDILELVDVFRAKVVDVSVKELMIEIAGPEAKIEAFIDLLRSYGVKELARTGSIALSRGVKK